MNEPVCSLTIGEKVIEGGILTFSFPVLFERNPEGGWSVSGYPGANGQGETMEDALVNFAEGVRELVRYRQEKAAK